MDHLAKIALQGGTGWPVERPSLKVLVASAELILTSPSPY
jgi:hypothetical protein